MKKLFLLSTSIFCVLFLQAQTTVSGIVTDPDGNPVYLASIVIKETNQGVLTGLDGNYTIQVPQNGLYTFIASYLGYEKTSGSILIEGKPVVRNIQFTRRQIVDITRIPIEVFKSPEQAGSYQDISKTELEEQNFGQDLPYMLRLTPSMVSTSDAGAGVGYTGMRIRGSDATRINVTVNGIPLNDSESHGLFWVNMPDFASSIDQLQIQRGVGSSSNGAGAFGATIGIDTQGESKEAFARFQGSAGSFNTFKSGLSFGTGVINNHWIIEGRRSIITSDGFVDRAASDLSSNYLSATYFNNDFSITGIMINGRERTYQSWWGVPESKLNGDTAALAIHIANNGYDEEETENLLNSDPRTYNYYTYENEVDNYAQDHYQLHFNTSSRGLKFSTALHYTYGRGYFEQYRKDEDLVDYGLNPVFLENDTINSTDLIRRRWLDNDFYGITFNVSEEKGKRRIVFGGAANEYAGDHFGRIIWSQFSSNSELDTEYYSSVANKRDANVYLKYQQEFRDRLNVELDLQYRFISYESFGMDNDRRTFRIDENFNFFNPKLHSTYNLNNQMQVYANLGVANKEPVRSDFIDAVPGAEPQAENLINLETGFLWRTNKYFFQANLYYMDYRDQLVLTGAVNDVGAAVRTNVDRSFRRGIELSWGYEIAKGLNWEGNIALSQNKIQNLDENIVDYLNGGVIVNTMEDTDIAFSPNIIVGNSFRYQWRDNWQFMAMTKYVGDQYLDNTSNEDRKLDAYLVNDLTLEYRVKQWSKAQMSLGLQVNNILDAEYANNGYTYSYAFGDVITENFLFPQAGRNFMFRLTLEIREPKPAQDVILVSP